MWCFIECKLLLSYVSVRRKIRLIEGREGIGAATSGFEVEGDTRQYSVQNYHVLSKKRNVSATVSMPLIGKDDPMGCLSCPAPHSIAESLRGGQPIVIILSDQTFPPVLPRQVTAGGRL
jgi:hypothetical protein